MLEKIGKGYTNPNENIPMTTGTIRLVDVSKDKTSWPCVFFEGRHCMVRQFYTLCPESLSRFCKACPWKDHFIKQALNSSSLSS